MVNAAEYIMHVSDCVSKRALRKGRAPHFEIRVRCDGSLHRIWWSMRGPAVLVDHTRAEIRARKTLRQLGDESCGCLAVLALLKKQDRSYQNTNTRMLKQKRGWEKPFEAMRDTHRCRLWRSRNVAEWKGGVDRWAWRRRRADLITRCAGLFNLSGDTLARLFGYDPYSESKDWGIVQTDMMGAAITKFNGEHLIAFRVEEVHGNQAVLACIVRELYMDRHVHVKRSVVFEKRDRQWQAIALTNPNVYIRSPFGTARTELNTFTS